MGKMDHVSCVRGLRLDGVVHKSIPAVPCVDPFSHIMDTIQR